MRSIKSGIIFLLLSIILFGCNEEQENQESQNIEPKKEISKIDHNEKKEDLSSGEQEEKKDDSTPVPHFIQEEDFQEFKEKGLNPFGQDVKQENLSGRKIGYYIHGMTHQKVKAKYKWIFFEMHPKRINWLLEGLEKTKYDLGEDKSKYREILERWKIGDYSKIVDDHNFIWSKNEGTKGKATGKLTKEEERYYLEREYEMESHFK